MYVKQVKHKKNLFNVVKKETLAGSIIIAIIFYYIFISFSNALFDRYFLIVSVLIVPVILKLFPEVFNYRVLLGICLFFQVLYSVFTTKDYLQTNRIKWEAIDYAKTILQAKNTDINSGYIFDNFYLAEKNMQFDRWLNQPPNRFVISHQKISGYNAVKGFPFQRFLPMKTDTVFVLERE